MGRVTGAGKRPLVLLALVVVVTACATNRSALEGRAVTLEGEIIDPQCYYTHGGRGQGHRTCALFCARGGQDLAFLNRAGEKVYPIIAARHGENPNDSLYAVVGFPVVLMGAVFERGGQRVLRVDRIERLDKRPPTEGIPGADSVTVDPLPHASSGH